MNIFGKVSNIDQSGMFAFESERLTYRLTPGVWIMTKSASLVEFHSLPTSPNLWGVTMVKAMWGGTGQSTIVTNMRNPEFRSQGSDLIIYWISAILDFQRKFHNSLDLVHFYTEDQLFIKFIISISKPYIITYHKRHVYCLDSTKFSHADHIPNCLKNNTQYPQYWYFSKFLAFS